MNEIVTPPGYVEYPRDPKFRAPDTFRRLELLGEGMAQFKWWSAFMAIELGFNGSFGQPFTWSHFGFSLLFGVFVVLFVGFGLSKIFQGYGWRRGYAILVALVPAVLGVLYRARVLEHWGFGVMYAVVLLGIWFAARTIVDGEFRRFGVKLPLHLSEQRVKALVDGLRSAEQSTPAIEVG